MNRLVKAVILFGVLLALILTTVVFTGCSGAGFDKRATLMPDRVGISLGQARYREEDSAYRMFGVSAQWDLK